MLEEFEANAKQVGHELINLSELLSAKMEKWGDLPMRPQGLSATEWAGYINKESADTGLQFVIDVIAPNDESEASLRIWAIESKPDNNRVERFNNIQLTYTPDHTHASETTRKGKDISRNDIQLLLQAPSTRLSEIVISNQLGRDPATQKTLGERYDLTRNEIKDSKMIDKIKDVLQATFSILKASATTEHNRLN